jgi:hypothetical protein
MAEVGTSRQISHIPESGEEKVEVAALDPFASVPSGKHHMWWLLLLAIACIAGVMVSENFNSQVDSFFPESLPNPSTYNRKPSGYSGLMELTEKLGMKTSKWQLPYRYLKKKNASGTLILVAPQETPSSSEVNQIADWIKQGNNLIYLDYFSYRTGKAMTEKFDVEPFDSVPLTDKILPLDPKLAEAAFVKDLVVSGDVRLNGGVALVADSHGALLSEIKYGKGRILIGSVPTMASNRRLQERDQWGNFQFLANWLRANGGEVMFDEKSHGFSSQTNILVFMAKSPVGLLIFQLLVIALVALISLNQRFGAPIPVSTRRKISNLEFIDGLAATYRRARARDTVWGMIFHSFKAKLCKKLQVAPHEGYDKLAEEWALSTGQSKAECEAFLTRAQASLDHGKMSQDELVELVSTCDRLNSQSKTLATTGAVKGA